MGLGGVIAIVVAVTMTGMVATAGAVEPVTERRVLYRAAETGGSIAVDSSAYGNDGVLKGGVTRRYGSFRFHPVSRDGAYDRIRAPFDASLNPGSAPFTYGARVKVRPDATWSHSEMAVIRLGDSDTPGGDYKLELRRIGDGTVQLLCVMHDGLGGEGRIQGNGSLATVDDGRWHRISCSRLDEDTVAFTVDGETTTRDLPVDAKLGAIDSVDDSFLIGAQPSVRKPVLRFREQFHGAMDDIHVTVSVAQPATTP